MDLEFYLWVNVTKLDFLLTKDVVTSTVVICMIEYVKMVPSTAMSGVQHKQLRVGGMPWPKTGAIHCHKQLGLLDKGRAIKELVV